MRMFFKSIRNYILSLSMNAFYTTNESSTRHHISDTGYEQPRNEDYDVCPPSESDCPMITVWRWPSLVLSPASDTSTHFHIITLTQCKCQMFTNSWVKLSRSPMLGSMVVVTNPLSPQMIIFWVHDITPKQTSRKVSYIWNEAACRRASRGRRDNQTSYQQQNIM